jgi:hypothetical protein
MNHNTTHPNAGHDDIAIESALKGDLSTLRTALSSHNTPTAVEMQLHAAFAARQRRLSGGGSRWLHGLGNWLAPGSAIALSVSLSAWLLLSAPPSAMVMPALNQSAAWSQSGAQNDTPFIALRPLSQIELEPNPRVIETSVPRLMLAELGVSVSPEVAGESMQAQMLVSAAGQPLALRFK